MQRVFQGAAILCVRPKRQSSESPIRTIHSRQATLHTALGKAFISYRNAGLPCPVEGSITTEGVRPPTKAGLHTNRVTSRMPLQGALKVQAYHFYAFLPAPTPNWAFKAGTRGFTDMPFKGFLGPSWKTAVLTRILRRCIYIISRKYAFFNTVYIPYIR